MLGQIRYHPQPHNFSHSAPAIFPTSYLRNRGKHQRHLSNTITTQKFNLENVCLHLNLAQHNVKPMTPTSQYIGVNRCIMHVKKRKLKTTKKNGNRNKLKIKKYEL